jgi:YHS domain-containing protein
MFQRIAPMAAFAVGVFALTLTAADTKPDPVKVKKGLQDIGEFVGQWNLTTNSNTSKSWKETITIGWKFKDGDSWLTFDVKDAKHLASGELRYDPEKKTYTLKTVDKDKKEALYAGQFKKGKLTLEGKDEKSSDVTKLVFSTISEGVRLSLQVETQKGGSGPFETLYKAAGNKEGESFAGGGSKKPVCIVTGGTATISVSYMGKTYYVCCSGCRDEFNANPQKYIDAAEKAKK